MKKRVTIEELTFTVAYIFFVFYLYNRDVSNPEIFYGITEMVKYGALLSLTIGICCSEYKKRQTSKTMFVFILNQNFNRNSDFFMQIHLKAKGCLIIIY